MAKKILLNILKAAVAAGLLWWLVSSGRLDWAPLRAMTQHSGRLFVVFLLSLLNLILVTWRWSLLLRTRARHVPLGPLFVVNWIGAFFNIVLPGSITGDLAKVFYVKRHNPELSHAFLLFSAFFDRLMGLAGVILLMGFFSLLNYGALSGFSPRLIPLLHFNFLLLAGMTLAATIYFFFPSLPARALAALAQRFPGMKALGRVQELWGDLVSAKGPMAQAALISVGVQFVAVLIFHTLASPHYTVPLPLMTELSFIPLGFMAVALPLAPAGLGVGHAAFEALFGFAGQAGGANFFNMYFVMVVVFGLLGILPWLAWRNETRPN